MLVRLTRAFVRIVRIARSQTDPAEISEELKSLLATAKVKIADCITAKDNVAATAALSKKIWNKSAITKSMLEGVVDTEDDADPWYVEVGSSLSDSEAKKVMASFIVCRLASGGFKEPE